MKSVYEVPNEIFGAWWPLHFTFYKNSASPQKTEVRNTQRHSLWKCFSKKSQKLCQSAAKWKISFPPRPWTIVERFPRLETLGRLLRRLFQYYSWITQISGILGIFSWISWAWSKKKRYCTRGTKAIQSASGAHHSRQNFLEKTWYFAVKIDFRRVASMCLYVFAWSFSLDTTTSPSTQSLEPRWMIYSFGTLTSICLCSRMFRVSILSLFCLWFCGMPPCWCEYISHLVGTWATMSYSTLTKLPSTNSLMEKGRKRSPAASWLCWPSFTVSRQVWTCEKGNRTQEQKTQICLQKNMKVIPRANRDEKSLGWFTEAIVLTSPGCAWWSYTRSDCRLVQLGQLMGPLQFLKWDDRNL